MQIAEERIRNLLEMAYNRKRDGKDPSRLLEIAEEISESENTSIPEQNRILCEGCGDILLPGRNIQVRIRSGKSNIVYRCECGEVERFGF